MLLEGAAQSGGGALHIDNSMVPAHVACVVGYLYFGIIALLKAAHPLLAKMQLVGVAANSQRQFGQVGA